MAGRNGGPFGDIPDGFERCAPDSAKIKCSTCGRSGYRGGSWMNTCLNGHRLCPGGCGRYFGIRSSGTAITHNHYGCPGPSGPEYKGRHRRA